MPWHRPSCGQEIRAKSHKLAVLGEFERVTPVSQL
jgi:hypothetical protein